MSSIFYIENIMINDKNTIIIITLLIVILSLFHSNLFATTILSPIGYQTDFEDEEERKEWILNPLNHL